MPIIKSKVETGYTVVDNEIIDGPLSKDAIAVLIWLISRPSDWIVIKSVIKKKFRIGEHVFRRVYRELLEAGYIEEISERTKIGRFSHKIINVYDKPKGAVRKPCTRKPERMTVDKPHAENPPVDKQALLNTDNSINKNTTNNEQKSGLLQPESEIPCLIEQDILNGMSARQVRSINHEAKGLDKQLLQQVIQEFKLQRSDIRSAYAWLLAVIKNAKNGCFTPTDTAAGRRDDEGKVKDEQRRKDNQRKLDLSLAHAREQVLCNVSGLEPAKPGQLRYLMMNADQK